MAIDLFEQLADSACQAARAFFEKCRAQAKGKTLSGLAFCPDNDVHSVFLMAQTEEGLSKQVDQFFKKNAKALAGQKVTREQIESAIRYQAPDWDYSDNKAAAVNSAFSKLWDFHDESLSDGKAFRAVRKKCLEALVKGLKAFDRDHLTPAVDRDNFTLLIFFPDPDDPKEVKALAKQLNPPAVFKRFKANYYADE